MYRHVIIVCFLLTAVGLDSASAWSWSWSAEENVSNEPTTDESPDEFITDELADNAIDGDTGRAFLITSLENFGENYNQTQYEATLKEARDEKIELNSKIRKTNIATILVGAIVAGYSTVADVVVAGGVITAAIGAYKMYFQEEVDDKDRNELINSCKALIGIGDGVLIGYKNRWDFEFTSYGENIVPQDKVDVFLTETEEISTQIRDLRMKCS